MDNKTNDLLEKVKEEAYLEQDWITVENYKFKILIMIAVLSENHLAYRGKLKDMCEFLNINNVPKNTQKIKQAILALEKENYLKVLVDGRTWTLTLTEKAEKEQRIIKIRKHWIKGIQKYKAQKGSDSVSWEKILKALMYIWNSPGMITCHMVGEAIGVSDSTARKAIIALENLNIDDFEFNRKIKYLKNKYNQLFCVGQDVTMGINFVGETDNLKQLLNDVKIYPNSNKLEE